MHRLCTLLGMPQRRFGSVHVVGTNGKTSVTRMTAALVQAHGVPAGAYLSPHIHDWRERVLIGDGPIGEAAFTEALERAEQAAQTADRAAGDEGPVTQYELLTAAAFVAFAAAGVQMAVIEAGLGGRLDATNVIPSKATVLTSVDLDHTEWLGDTVEEIAAEKLAVLRDHTTLVTGPLPDELAQVVEGEVGRHHATRISVELEDGSGFPALNFRIAQEAAQAALDRELDPDAVRAVTGHLFIPGRAQLVDGDPPAIFDAAHNAQGARALAELLPRVAAGRDVVGCIAVLEEKDADAIVGALAPLCSQLVCTEIPERAMEGAGRPGARSRPAAELAEIASAAGAEAEPVADPVAAWERARELARGRSGVALAAGSHYLLKCI